MPTNANSKRIAALKAENQSLKEELERLRADHQTVRNDLQRNRENIGLLLSTNHRLATTAARRTSQDWVASGVLAIVRRLASDPAQVRRDRSLGSLQVPLDTLKRDLETHFFDGKTVFATNAFKDSTLVGTVIYMVRAKLRSL